MNTKHKINLDTVLTILYMLFGVALVTANCISNKLMDFSLFGLNANITVGVVAYPFTFLITDIIGEFWGKDKAKVAVWGGFLAQLLALLMIKIAGLFPAGALSGVTAETYETVFGNMTAFVIASLAAYLVAQNVDVLIFHGIRDAYIKKHGSIKGGRWIWNNGSTIVSQLIDSAVFGVIAYGFGLHLPADAIVMSVIAQWLFKAIIAVCDTPIFYACTSLLRKVKPEENA